jgi:hypothetical protein
MHRYSLTFTLVAATLEGASLGSLLCRRAARDSPTLRSWTACLVAAAACETEFTSPKPFTYIEQRQTYTYIHTYIHIQSKLHLVAATLEGASLGSLLCRRAAQTHRRCEAGQPAWSPPSPYRETEFTNQNHSRTSNNTNIHRSYIRSTYITCLYMSPLSLQKLEGASLGSLLSRCAAEIHRRCRAGQPAWSPPR